MRPVYVNCCITPACVTDEIGVVHSPSPPSPRRNIKIMQILLKQIGGVSLNELTDHVLSLAAIRGEMEMFERLTQLHL